MNKLQAFIKYGLPPDIIDLSYMMLGDDEFKSLLNDLPKIDTKCTYCFCCGINQLTAASTPVLGKIIELFPNLRDLNLGTNRYDQFGGRVMSELTNSFGDSIATLAPILASKPLRSLNLQYNKITSDGIKNLLSGLKTDCKIEKLILDGNPIGDQGAKEIAKILGNFKRIKKLSMNNCSITATGLIEILEASSKLNSLASLSFYGNYFIRIEDRLAKALEGLSLKSLDLGNCVIGEGVSKALIAKSLPSKIYLDFNNLDDSKFPSDTLINSISETSQLSLSWNSFSDSYISAITNAITTGKAPKLVSVKIDDMNISPAVANELNTALNTNAIKLGSKDKKKRRSHHHHQSTDQSSGKKKLEKRSSASSPLSLSPKPPMLPPPPAASASASASASSASLSPSTATLPPPVDIAPPPLPIVDILPPPMEDDMELKEELQNSKIAELDRLNKLMKKSNSLTLRKSTMVNPPLK